MASRDYDWRRGIRGWRYKTDAPGDEEWQRDRLKLFKENGNGWWWGTEKKEYRTRSKNSNYWGKWLT
jgi:hypothetical protein